MKNTYGFFVAALLLISGCAGVNTPPSIPETPPGDETITQTPEAQPTEEEPLEPAAEGTLAPTEEIPVAAEVVPPPAEESPPIVEEPPQPMSNNRAVLALLDQAQANNTSGKYASAGASLERALRIEPRNPWLWQELAQVRLSEGQYTQAISLARKSNSLAGGRPRVQAENWQVIGKAYVAMGDSTNAEQAFSQSAKLRQQAPSPAAASPKPGE